MNQVKAQLKSHSIKSQGRDLDGRLPQEALNEVCQKMGADSSELGGEAAKIWTMLNDLHEHDPDSYLSFLKDQLDQETGCANVSKAKDSTNQSFLFIPEKGFVIKTWINAPSSNKVMALVSKTNKFFINVCHYNKLRRPTTDQGKQVEESDLSTNSSLNVPMLISKMRETEDKNGSKSYAVDVILHPWAIQQAQKDAMFKVQFIELILHSVAKECAIIFAEKSWKILKSTYKGGTGPNSTKVLPFYMSNSRSNSRIDPELNIISTTSELIKKRNDQNDEQNLDITESTVNKGSHPKPVLKAATPLIQEVSTKQHVSQNCERNGGQNLRSQMKGFLDNKNGSKPRKPLYDENGSSGTGLPGTGGTWARLMSRCKVVDTAEMMTQNNANAAKKIETNNKPLKKGFLKGKSLSSPKSYAEEGVFDSELQKLAEMIDPDMAVPSKSNYTVDKGEDLLENLSSLLSR